MKKLLASCLTVVLCLCCLASCGILGFHSISYQDADTESLLMDGYAPKRAKPGDTVVLRTGTIMDADLDFYANGVKLENTHNDSDYWEYTFIMPDEDVVITHKMSDGFIQGECEDHVDEDANGTCDNCGHKIEHEHTGEWYMNEKIHFYEYTCGCESPDIAELHLDSDNNGFCDICGYEMPEIVSPTNYFLRDQLGAEWLEEIKPEDVAMVKTIFEYVGVAPGRKKYILTSTNQNDIVYMLEKCYWLDISPIPHEEGFVCGGSATTVKFILKDGAVKKLYFNNGNYRDTSDNYFELSYLPKFEDESNLTKSYAFITLKETANVYSIETQTIVCEIPMDEIEFVYFNDVIPTEPSNYPYAINVRFGELAFINNQVFYLVNNSEVYYKLLNTTLDELVAKYS